MSDEDLVFNSICGDQESFEMIVIKYEKLIYSICYRMFQNPEDSLDFTQETFIKIYKNMGKAVGKGSFKSWICTIATNTCLDELRKRKNKITISLDINFDNNLSDSYINFDIADQNTPLDELLKIEKYKLLNTAINKLSNDNKIVIILRDIEGLSYDEISKVLGVSLGTVKSRISRARKKLQKIYIELSQQR